MFRLLGLLGALSVATDMGTGAPLEESLKRSLVASRLARRIGCTDDEVREVTYIALLMHLGCTAYSHELAGIFGDDVAANRMAWLTDFDRTSDVMRTFVPGVALATGRSRARVAFNVLTEGRRVDAAAPAATCEVARDAARRLDLSEGVQDSLFHITARWDGRGYPAHAGDAIPLGARIMHVASTAVTFALQAGTDAALAEVARHAGTYLDPGLVASFSADLLADLEDVDADAAVLDAEPDPVLLVDDADVEVIARTFGDVVDLKSPWLHGHSSGVAELAGRAGALLALPDVRSVRIAGHLHDIGRVGVSSRIWDKAGPLTTTERDQARLHPYFTERVLCRVPALAEVATLASQHHERSDGSGYHRGITSSQLSLPSRVLAAADCYRSKVEQRPYRPATSPADAAQHLRQEARAARLDVDAVAAVLEAAGQGRGGHRVRPAGLTERQVEVLRLIARGLSNREIAARLVISPRTAEHHAQDVYTRIGASTRAGAALFAMEHGLLDGSG